MLRGIKLRHLIEHFAVALECLKTVRKSFGDEQRLIIATAQHFRDILLVGWRFAAQVDDHVVNCPSCATHKLCFGAGSNLVMHAAKRALQFVERYVALHRSWIQAASSELLLAPGPRKEAALIFVLL